MSLSEYSKEIAVRLPRPIVLGALWIAAAAPSAADVPFRLEQQEVVRLQVDVLQVRPGQTNVLTRESVDLVPGTGGTLETEVPWTGGPARLVLQGRGVPGNAESGHGVSIEVVLEVEDERFRSNRDFRMFEHGSYLMDVHEDDRARMVLAFRAEATRRTVAIPQVKVVVGVPVRLRLEVERVDGDRIVPLETNQLNTFIGQDVEYSFRRGDGDASESVRLRLKPLTIKGDLTELEVEVNGSLPGTPDRLLLSRRETLLSSRGAVSSLLVASGEPPGGYRFLITPEF